MFSGPAGICRCAGDIGQVASRFDLPSCQRPSLLDRPEQLHFLPSLPGNFHVMRHDAGLASTLHFHSPLRGSLETPGKTLSALYEMVDSREKKSEHKMREVSH